MPRGIARLLFVIDIALNTLFKKKIFVILLNDGDVIGLSHIRVSRNKRYGEEGIVLLKEW
jgi:hypothetical protein